MSSNGVAGLNGEVLQVFRESPPEVQEKFLQWKTDRETAKELTDGMVELVKDKSVAADILKMIADCLLKVHGIVEAAAENTRREADESESGKKVL